MLIKISIGFSIKMGKESEILKEEFHVAFPGYPNIVLSQSIYL